MVVSDKDWDDHVRQTEELAQTPGFERLRDRISELAAVRPDDVVVDLGSGTGLLALALAPRARKVWAVDISEAMTGYLGHKATQAGIDNLKPVTASVDRLPLPDGSATVIVSNYCLHHLSDADKRRALAEAFRVLRPGGRIVVADMMFRVELSDARNRWVIASKVKAILKRGPMGLVRLLKNALRLITRHWEQPADGGWWRSAFSQAGFDRVRVELLEHEGGIVTARRPGERSRSRRRRHSPVGHERRLAQGPAANSA
jgi:ubiquinone/menaquinone biosynthesis C-methylase UbiE